ncbi:hypothetical protein H0H92_011663 [Tricholoma furcatifolium]|nr:hypothetical protein H0H92_011663 [Tricholoma furcatifolium]
MDFPDSMSEDEKKKRQKYSKGKPPKSVVKSRPSPAAEPAPQPNSVISLFNEMNTACPRKQPVLHLYSNRNYQSKFKKDCDAAWAKVIEEKGSPGSTRLQFINEYVRAEFNKETQAVRDKYERESEDLYKKEMQQYKLRGIWKPRTAAEYKE